MVLFRYQSIRRATKQPLVATLRPFGARLFAAEGFTEETRRIVAQLFGEDRLYSGGLSVRTTLDPKLQIYARQALTGWFDQVRSHEWLARCCQADGCGRRLGHCTS